MKRGSSHHFFHQQDEGLTDHRVIFVLSDPGWYALDDGQLDDALVSEVAHALKIEYERSHGLLNIPDFFIVDSWRCNDQGYRFPGVGRRLRVFAKDYDVLRTARNIEVRVIAHYPVPDAARIEGING